MAGTGVGQGQSQGAEKLLWFSRSAFPPIWEMDLENHCPHKRPHSAEPEQELEVLSRFFAGSVPCPQGELRGL